MSLALITLAFILLRRHVERHATPAPVAAARPASRRAAQASFAFGVVPYLLDSALAWRWPTGALLLYALVPVYFVAQTGGRVSPHRLLRCLLNSLRCPAATLLKAARFAHSN